eukprot:gene8093-1336_t
MSGNILDQTPVTGRGINSGPKVPVFVLGLCRKVSHSVTNVVEVAAIVVALHSRHGGKGTLHRAAGSFLEPVLLARGARLVTKLCCRPKLGGGVSGELARLVLDVEPVLLARVLVLLPSCVAAQSWVVGHQVRHGGKGTLHRAAGSFLEPVLLARDARLVTKLCRRPKLCGGASSERVEPVLLARYHEWVSLAKNMLTSRDVNLPASFDVDGLELTRQLIAAGLCKIVSGLGDSCVRRTCAKLHAAGIAMSTSAVLSQQIEK